MSRPLAVLFLAALAGVLLVLGLLVASLGALPAAAYAVLVLALLGVGLRQAVRLRVAGRPGPTGRTCTCCTSTVHDPVRVI